MNRLTAVAALTTAVCVTGCGDGISGNPPGGGSGGSSEVLEPLPTQLCGVNEAPLRRLTKFEYSNTVRDVLADATSPANDLPSEESGNGFGNDAASQSVSSLLAQSYRTVAEGIAARATASREQMALVLDPCAATATVDTEPVCATAIINAFAPKAYRRALQAGEAEELLALYTAARVGLTFEQSIAGVIEAVLQSPDFLYKLEWGVADPTNPAIVRPTEQEMAVRLSYLMWGTAPDAALQASIGSGELLTKAGVLAQATRLLAAPQSRAMLRFFFHNFLPLNTLSNLERDETLFPTFSGPIGAAMLEETQTFLEYEIFRGSGTWSGMFTAPYTFVNQALAEFYGIPGVTGDTFQQVTLPNPAQRAGLLTQGGMMAGTTHSNKTSPVLRGSFVVNQLMCQNIPLPTDPAIIALVQKPEPYEGDTARERFTQHSANPVCAGCHANLDPIGFGLENFDPVGLWRDTENGATIDPSGNTPTLGEFSGPVELGQKIGAHARTQACFVSNWMNFAYGRTLGESDQCAADTVNQAFTASGGNIKQLLLDLTQTDAFLYLPATR